MNIDDVKREIREIIVATLLIDEDPGETFAYDTQLFVEGLALDSVDALELGVELEKKYKIKIDADAQKTQEHFESVNTLAAFVISQVTPGLTS